MATLRKNCYTERKPRGERGRGTPFSGPGPTGIKMNPPETIFTAAIDDVYGPHVVFGDEAERKIRQKSED